jgi:hypothetical protein
MPEAAERGSPVAARASRRTSLTTILAIALVAVLAGRRLYRSPYSASELSVAPDEIEYAVCAKRIATLGRYDMDFDGVSVPPRSTPWFSMLLAPVYWAAPDELGNGIWAVFAFAVIGVVVLHRIGTRIVGPAGGVMAVIAVLAMPHYPPTARSIMTDTPAVVLALGCLWLFLRWNGTQPRVRESVIAGLLVALAFALRSVYLSLLVPFAWRAWRVRERRFAHLVSLLSPIVAVLVANAVYNHAAFGDWRRTGYQFWAAVPCDYPDLVLSPAYLRGNLALLASPEVRWTLGLAALGTVAIVVRRPRHGRALFGFGAITALPISLFHSFYFFPDVRFHLYLLTLSMLLGAIGVVSILPATPQTHRVLELLAPLLLVGAVFMLKPLGDRMPGFLRDGRPPRRALADLVHHETPDGSVVISDLEPVYIGALAPLGSHRTYLALSRGVEFASKVLARTRIERELAAPRNAFDHAAPGLLAHGAQWAVPHTADEMHSPIDAWVRAGRPVFYATLHPPSRARAAAVYAAALGRVLGGTLCLDQPSAHLTRIVAVD